VQPKYLKLTESQIEIVAQLLQMKAETRLALKLVLLQGLGTVEAAEQTGFRHSQHVSRALRVCMEAHQLILTGYSPKRKKKAPEKL